MDFSLCVHFIMLFAGLGWGFLAMPSCVYSLAAVLPKFDDIQDLTKLETSHLLYIVLRSPAMWLAFTFCVLLAVNEFLATYLLDCLLGLGVALVLVIRECYAKRNQEQKDILSALKKEILSPITDPAERFPPYSPRQMRLANWRPTQVALKGFRELTYQCAVCYQHRKLSEIKACFRGNRNRYIVECDRCGQPSIIRLAKGVFSEYEVITEARMPEHRRTDEERPERAPVALDAVAVSRTPIAHEPPR
jgi:hypothetical protein